ncbi:MAG TPA: nitroreductase family protein [Acidimicrobiales bacterium]|jgi:nitroreductase|nr:nitroreductase family protein [Acidimicrobiales bacterium]
METWDAIRSRRNTREYSDKPVAREDLERILEAGRRAPSSTNWQPWDFVVVTARDKLQALSEVWQGAGHVATSQATIAVIAPAEETDFSRQYLLYDLGQATALMTVAAADLGIGTAHAASKNQDVARKVLGLPDDKVCAFVLSVGYPADRPLAPVQNPERRPFEEVVHWSRW